MSKTSVKVFHLLSLEGSGSKVLWFLGRVVLFLHCIDTCDLYSGHSLCTWQCPSVASMGSAFDDGACQTLQYVKTYPTCQMVKSDNRAKAGLLRTLEISPRKLDLPESNVYTAIAVFMDKLTKMAHLACCTKEVTAMEYAKLFVDRVF